MTRHGSHTESRMRENCRPFCVFCGKVRGANGRDKRVPPALYPDRPSPARQAGAGCLRLLARRGGADKMV